MVYQEAAIGVAEQSGTVIAAANPVIEDEPTAGLSPRQNEVFTLLLKDFSYKRIADELGFSLTTARTHIHAIYKKWNVASKFQLVHALSTDGEIEIDGGISNITEAQYAVLRLMGDGIVAKNIATIFVREESTIRDHQSALRKRLGKNSVELASFANILRKKNLAAAQTVQPVLTRTLARMKTAQTGGVLKADESGNYKINNPALLRKVHDNDYISEKAWLTGRVDSSGLAAALLFKNPNTAALMADPTVQDGVREVFDREVAMFPRTGKANSE